MTGKKCNKMLLVPTNEANIQFFENQALKIRIRCLSETQRLPWPFELQLKSFIMKFVQSLDLSYSIFFSLSLWCMVLVLFRKFCALLTISSKHSALCCWRRQPKVRHFWLFKIKKMVTEKSAIKFLTFAYIFREFITVCPG